MASGSWTGPEAEPQQPALTSVVKYGQDFVIKLEVCVTPNLQTIVLTANSWNCGSCDILYLSQWIRVHSQTVKSVDGKTVDPDDVTRSQQKRVPWSHGRQRHWMCSCQETREFTHSQTRRSTMSD
ncbi:unnamed protein product [Lampetra planeri]